MTSLVVLLFFLSGACGLVYEVVWTRMMTHVFGSTALAVGTVLAAFMSGLALGAWLLGRYADRSRNRLRLYAWLEFGVAAAAVVAHLLLSRITPAYLGLYEAFGRSASVLAIARFVLAFVLVMAPTILMGATLPVLAKFVVNRLSGLGAGLSTLYAVNTAGAVIGAFLAGFYLIGQVGVHATVYFAAIGNAAVGALAWIASGSLTAASAGKPAGEKASVRNTQRVDRRTVRLVIAGLAVAGMASFAYEIYWTRSLVFLLGNSTYAVTTMLVAFLIGISLGGYLIRFLIDRVGDRVGLFGWLQILVGLSAAAAMPVLFSFVDPHSIREQIWEATLQSRMVTPVRFGVSIAVMLVPATLIGAAFPLAGRIGASSLEKAGADVGRIYAINTLGNVAGALLPGLILLSWLGIQRGIMVMALLNIMVGLGVLFLRAGSVKYLRWAVPVAVLVAGLVIARIPLDFQFPSESQGDWSRVLYYRDGPSATTAVLYDPEIDEMVMSLDGIDIGGSGPTDYKQQLLAHLPKLLLDDVARELSVGFGSGILAGESARHGRVESILCAEIEPTVVEGAKLFAAENHGVMEDPRFSIVVDDIGNHLRTTTDRYQVVSADEKTAQGYASNGFSYSREYYELILARLAPGGLMIQWVPTSLPPHQYRMVLKTFTESFPYVSLWFFAPAFQSAADNTILVGSNEKIVPDLDRARRWMASEASAFAGIGHYGFTTAETVLASFVTNEMALRPALENEPVNSLDHPRYEFYSPSDYAVPTKQRFSKNFEFLMRLRLAGTPAYDAAISFGQGSADSLQSAVDAESEFLAGYAGVLAHVPLPGIFARFDAALALAPWNESLRVRILSQYWSLSSRYAGSGDLRMAAELKRRGLAVYGNRALNWAEYGQDLLIMRDLPGAIDAGKRAVATDARLIAGRKVLARSFMASGQAAEAREQMRAILKLDPRDEEALRALSGI